MFKTAISGSAIPSDIALNVALATDEKIKRSPRFALARNINRNAPAALPALRRAKALLRDETNFPRRQTNFDADQEKFAKPPHE